MRVRCSGPSTKVTLGISGRGSRGASTSTTVTPRKNNASLCAISRDAFVKPPVATRSVELYGQNLEDRDVFGRVIVLPEFLGGMPVGFEAFEPRTYGVRMGFHWGGE
jgi:hypothetical protein